MDVLFLSSEVAPWSKTGGLGDAEGTPRVDVHDDQVGPDLVDPGGEGGPVEGRSSGEGLHGAVEPGR